MKGFLVFTQPDEDGNTIAVDLSTGDFRKLSPKQPSTHVEEPESDNDGCFKAMILIVAVGASIIMGFTPKAAYACSGFIDCLFGLTDRTEVRAERDVEKARIEAVAAADIAKIQAEQTERLRQADAEVERVKQQQFATEAQRDIAIANAQAQVDQYKASIEALTAERLAGIQSNADSQIAALQAQAEIATAGILETGRTERYRIVGGWTFSIVALVLAGLLVALYLRRQPQRPVMMVTEQQRMALPWLNDNQIEIVEVKHAIRRK